VQTPTPPHNVTAPRWLITRIGLVLLWTLCAGALYLIARYYNYSIFDIVVLIMRFFETNPWSPLLYIFVYTLQPFAFMPSTIFTILAGAIFGFWPAFLYTAIGANLSASVVYATGRLLAYPNSYPRSLTRWVTPLHTRPFYTLLFLRLAYFPFDVTNISAGLLKIAYRPFVAATFIGAIPAIATLTAFGASFDLDTFLAKGSFAAAINPLSLFISATLFVGTIAIVEIVRRWQRRTTTFTTAHTSSIENLP